VERTGKYGPPFTTTLGMAFAIRARPSWNRLLTVVAIGVGIVAVVTVVILSLDPNNYFYYWPRQMAEWRYPAHGVIVTVLSVVVETALVYAALLTYRRTRLWMRGLAALAILIPLAGYNFMFIVHSPIYHITHVLYALSAVLTVLVATLCSVTMHVWERFRPLNAGHA
jgi:drug/metabolite transporter (DMT)-like permease